MEPSKYQTNGIIMGNAGAHILMYRHILPHGSYLVNLAQEDKAKAKQAYNSFVDDLHRCEALGIKLYNFQ